MFSSHVITGTVAVILIFGLAVFVHEFGHMLFALLRGVGVESFAIGMGPKICTWHWRGIEFSLRWIPAGGFVKLKGMGGEDEPEAVADVASSSTNEEPGGALTIHDVKVDDGQPNQNEKTLTEASYDDMLALANKSFLTKLMVFGGGVFMNFLTAIAAVALLLFMGQDEPRIKATIEAVTANTQVARAGLQAGDAIIEANGKSLTYVDELQTILEQQAKEQDIKIETEPISLSLLVERAGGQRASVDLQHITLTDFRDAAEFRMPPVIGGTYPHFPAEKAGIRKGDRITAINAQPVASFNQMADLIRASLGKEVKISALRDGKPMEFTVTPTENLDDATKGQIGIVPGGDAMHRVREPNPVMAVVRAPMETVGRVQALVMLQYEFFRKATFKQIRDNLGGPIAIADVTQRKAREGFRPLLDWFINFNLLLMIFNLLPIPVLDGGFILLAAIEGIARRPVSPKILQPIYTVFVIFFISLMVVISLWDIKKFLF
jgi:regulator of sigma E protease